MIIKKAWILFLTLTVSAYAEDWTASWKTYHNVVVTKIETDRVHITFDGGVGTVALADLTPELQKRFNDDPLKAKAAAAQKEDDAKPDWQHIGDDFLVTLVDRVKQETDNAKTSDQKRWLRCIKTTS